MSESIKSNCATITKDYPFSTYIPDIKISDNEQQIVDKMILFLKGKSVPEFKEITFASEIQDIINTNDITNTFPDAFKFQEFSDKINEFLKKMGVKNSDKIANIIIDRTIGYGKIGNLLRDEDLEEIMINGPTKPIFIWHRRYGMCKTNIVYEQNELKALINKIAKSVGKTFNEQNPMLDARLSDGSRINATFDLVTPFGATITIRKFTKKPMSITKLIDNGTLTSELAAFLWICVEGFGINPMNILVIGGTGTGKTTLLISLTSFMRYSERIISIEDTPELNLSDRENWISLEARNKTENNPEIEMDDLLKNALRMRPDRIIVGEVRSKEAQTLFTAMDTGHKGILGTLHANNPKECILRLKSSPMNVPEMNIPLLDLIINIKKTFNEENGLIRIVSDVAEIERMDENVLLSNIFERNVKDKDIKKTDVPMRTIEKMSEIIGAHKQDIIDEIKTRKAILEWLVENEQFDYATITQLIQKYYAEPEEFLKQIYD